MMTPSDKAIKTFIVFCLLPISIRCATPYQPAGFTGGYSDFKIGPGKYMVTVNGNGYTSAATVRSYAYRRAREICLSHGYSEFEQLSDQESVDVSRTPDNYNCTADTRRYGYTNTTNVNCSNSGGVAVYKPGVSVVFSCVGDRVDSSQKESTPAATPKASSSRKKLGVILSPDTPRSGQGVIIDRVHAGSKAEAAGIRSGDNVKSVNGESVRSAGDINRSILEAEDGKVEITVCAYSGESCRVVTVEFEPTSSGNHETRD